MNKVDSCTINTYEPEANVEKPGIPKVINSMKENPIPY